MATIVIHSESERPVELRDPELSAFLAWLFPGLGHLYQRRFAKAALFCVCIMGLFINGLYLGSQGGRDGVGLARVVYIAGMDRLPFLCQVGVGLPTLPAVVQYFVVRRGGEPWLDGFMAPPKPIRFNDKVTPENASANDIQQRLTRDFELGTVYTMVAGLLNILAVFDAWAGPVFPEPPKRKEDDEPDDDKPSSAADKPSGET